MGSGRSTDQFGTIIGTALARRVLAMAPVGGRVVKHGRDPSLKAGLAVLLITLLANVAAAQTYALKGTFGTLGNGPGQFKLPYGVAIDPATRHIVVSDQVANRVQIFDATGAYLSQFGTFGFNKAQFNAPAGVAIDPTSHDIVVADFNNDRAQIFDSAGNFHDEFGFQGTGNGQFTAADGIAIDPASSNIIVSDAGRVEIFNSVGSYRSQFGSQGAGHGQFRTPIGVAIDPTSHEIFVADSGNNRVQVFDSTGVYKGQFGSAGNGNGQFARPVFVAIDPVSHNIFVADSGNNRVQIFDPAGDYLSQFATSGEPEGIAVDPDTLNIVVAIASNAQVQIFAPTAPDLDQHGLTGSWYDAATSGQGIEVEIYPDQSPGTGLAQISWFTYDTVAGGADHQRWYTLSGSVVSGQPSASLTIYQNTGGNFNALPITMAQAVGTATLSFDTCISGQLTYNFTDGTGRKGSIPLTRLTQNVTCSAATPYPTNADFAHSGNWYDPTTAGQGFTVEVNPDSGTLFAAWYTYAPMGGADGAAGQRWYTAQAPYQAGLRSIMVTLYETTGGLFNTPPPAGQQTVPVGTGTLAFQGCTTATFNYNFTAGSSSGLSGTISLSRVGPVPPGCT
jgi:DNA-binding beta-propeller fold protein YncE